MQLRRRGSYLSLEEPKGEDALTFSEKLPDSKPGPEEVCSASAVRDRVVNGISQLSPTLRRAFQLRDIDGLTTKEAALGRSSRDLKSAARKGTRQACWNYAALANRFAW
jgi:DNA-directed RNA polymerase specialized sigma24 family protein